MSPAVFSAASLLRMPDFQIGEVEADADRRMAALEGIKKRYEADLPVFISDLDYLAQAAQAKQHY